MEFLASSGIIHGDLKPQNILIKEDVIKIGDFGFSYTKTDKSFMKSNHCSSKLKGTDYYMAPEILDGEYSEKSDVFAFAMIIYFLFEEKDPIYDISSFQKKKNNDTQSDKTLEKRQKN